MEQNISPSLSFFFLSLSTSLPLFLSVSPSQSLLRCSLGCFHGNAPSPMVAGGRERYPARPAQKTEKKKNKKSAKHSFKLWTTISVCVCVCVLLLCVCVCVFYFSQMIGVATKKHQFQSVCLSLCLCETQYQTLLCCFRCR